MVKKGMENEMTLNKLDRKVITLYLSTEEYKNFRKKCFDADRKMTEVLREFVKKFVRE